MAAKKQTESRDIPEIAEAANDAAALPIADDRLFESRESPARSLQARLGAQFTKKQLDFSSRFVTLAVAFTAVGIAFAALGGQVAS